MQKDRQNDRKKPVLPIIIDANKSTKLCRPKNGALDYENTTLIIKSNPII